MTVNKPSVEYYNLEKVAEVLNISTAEVNRLRESAKLRGFRDGSNWKFLKDDIHTYLAESIKARHAHAVSSDSENGDFDLAEDDSSSFELLDSALPGDDQLISAAPPAQPKSDMDSAAVERDDDLALAEETQISSMVLSKKGKTPEPTPVDNAKFDAEFEAEFDADVEFVQEDALSYEESSALPMALSEAAFDIAIDGDSLVEADSSPGLASDSGIDILVADEEGSIAIQMDDEKTESAMASSEDFVLEPSSSMHDDADSESSSQVVAFDIGLPATESGVSSLGGSDDFGGFADFGSANFGGAGFGGGFSSAPAGEPLGAGASPMPSTGAFDTFENPVIQPKKPAVVESEYSTGVLVSLVFAVVVMLVSCVMLLDTVIHIWSWNEPFVLNSFIMNTVAGWFNL